MEKVLVLFSGGADSTLLLKLAEKKKKEVFALMIDYEQRNVKELEFASKYCDKNNVQYKRVAIVGYDVNSGLTGNREEGLYEGVHVSNVPARNSIFLSLAYGMAESMGIQEIWYGANFEDFEGKFPDCFQEYVGKFNELLEVAAVRPIKVYAPLLGMTKKMVLRLLASFGVGEDEIFSGYGGI